MPSLRWEPHAITSRGPMPPTDGGAGSAPTEVPPASVASVACPPPGSGKAHDQPAFVRCGMAMDSGGKRQQWDDRSRPCLSKS
jgi:hypothetical protein